MPLSQRMSEATRISMEMVDGVPLLDIEFKFVRYRLLIDDRSKAKQLISTLIEATNANPEKVKEDVKLPKFYKDIKKFEP